MKKFKSLAEAEVAYQLLEASSTDAAEKLVAAQDQAKVNFQSAKDAQARVLELEAAQASLPDVSAITAERDDFKAKLETAGTQISALTEDKTNLTNQLAEAQRISAEKVNAEATRIIAAGGHKPINLGAGGSNPAGEQVDPLAGLTGLDRARARLALKATAQKNKLS